MIGRAVAGITALSCAAGAVWLAAHHPVGAARRGDDAACGRGRRGYAKNPAMVDRITELEVV